MARAGSAGWCELRGATRFRSKDIKIARRAIVSGFAGNSRVLIWSSRSAASER